MEEFRDIPGYDGYAVSAHGVIKSTRTGNIISTYVWDDYLYADVRLSGKKSIRVNRAVALAWVNNPDPEKLIIVNHLDGDKKNNYKDNLEWTTHSRNNDHAVLNGFRTDCIACLVRDFETGKVTAHASIAKALEFVGLRKEASPYVYMPKKFGTLIRDRYELKFADDDTDWFYSERKERVPPSRFMLEVYESDGTRKEYYSTAKILKQFQLYKSKDRSIVGLAYFAANLYPDKKFVVRDSYIDPNFKYRKRRLSSSKRIDVFATNGIDCKVFNSLSKCAKSFNVDRSVILKRLNDRTDFNGWTFVSKPVAKVILQSTSPN